MSRPPRTAMAMAAAYVVTAVAGAGALVWAATLPWLDDEIWLTRGLRWTMAASGLVVLGVALRVRRSDGVGLALLILGGTVIAYPSLLTVAAADRGGPAIEVLANAGHVLPLTMVQLLPVLVSGQVLGRSHRRWAAVVLGVAAVGALVTGLGLALDPSGGPLLVVSTVLWFGSFVLAPIACWSALRHTTGQARRRGIVAGLAALVPVLVIVWCVTLGGLGSALALGDDATLTALFLGFSAATCGCALLSVAALGKADARLLRRSSVVGLMRALVVGVVVLVASGMALASATVLPTPGAAVLVAVALTVGLGWGATRLVGWTASVVDPAAELRVELERAAPMVFGQHRRTAESVVRVLAEDDDLELAFAVGNGVWVDARGHVIATGPEHVCLGREDQQDVVRLVSASAPARRHAQAWGDCTAALRPALTEAREEWYAGRADAAAEEERARIQQDLHDGLQGRLLGLALNLQMSQSEVDDPVTRLAIAETVVGLRAAVQDVRAMAGGRLPQILVDDGLEAAVRALLEPVGPRIGMLDLAPVLAGRRPPAAVEACAYFVVGEAVGNAIKHAGCDRIDVTVHVHDDRTVVVRVSDDGCGGADVRLGSGLRGLAERVEAHGGLLVVSDERPSGTLVEAVLPCGW